MTTLSFYYGGQHLPVGDDLLAAFSHKTGCPEVRVVHVPYEPGVTQPGATEEIHPLEAYVVARPANPQTGDPGADILRIVCLRCGADLYETLAGDLPPAPVQGAAIADDGTVMVAARKPRKKES